jgi:hypothetical protein
MFTTIPSARLLAAGVLVSLPFLLAGCGSSERVTHTTVDRTTTTAPTEPTVTSQTTTTTTHQN